MSVRQSLLAILNQGPCYGYQLRAEYERRTGGGTVNVGQVYNTLERLERDGLVRKGESDAQGHVFWHATDAGRAESAAWLAEAVPAAPRDEMLAKIALAVTLPGADALGAVRAQREATQAQRDELAPGAPLEDATDASTPEEFTRSLVDHALVLRAEAELRWLDEMERMLQAGIPGPWTLSEETPRRGRPRVEA